MEDLKNKIENRGSEPASTTEITQMNSIVKRIIELIKQKHL